MTAATLMGIGPERVHSLKEPGEFLGQGNLDQIEQRGENGGRSAMRSEPAPGFERLSA